jgi:hypothetical protein
MQFPTTPQRTTTHPTTTIANHHHPGCAHPTLTAPYRIPPPAHTHHLFDQTTPVPLPSPGNLPSTTHAAYLIGNKSCSARRKKRKTNCPLTSSQVATKQPTSRTSTEENLATRTPRRREQPKRHGRPPNRSPLGMKVVPLCVGHYPRCALNSTRLDWWPSFVTVVSL